VRSAGLELLLPASLDAAALVADRLVSNLAGA
jgi:hypothetical protein